MNNLQEDMLKWEILEDFLHKIAVFATLGLASCKSAEILELRRFGFLCTILHKNTQLLVYALKPLCKITKMKQEVLFKIVANAYFVLTAKLSLDKKIKMRYNRA